MNTHHPQNQMQCGEENYKHERTLIGIWMGVIPSWRAKILSTSRMRERHRVTFDTAMDNCFHAHNIDRKPRRFQEARRRVYYCDTVNRDEEGTMLTRVYEKKSKLSTLDLIQANRARALQRRIGRSTNK